MSRYYRCFGAALGAVALLMSGRVLADPLPGEVLKFQQLPQNGPIFFGHDEASMGFGILDPATGVLSGWRGGFMADDFADKFSTPVVHLRWWGSYLNGPGAATVDKFLIAFESDVPVGPNNPFSRPGTPLLNQIVRKGPLAPGSGTFTEKPAGGSAAEPLFEYNAELNLGKEFPQQPNTVYWLKIAALVDGNDPPFIWGWHNRDYTIPDSLASTPPAVSPGESMVGTVPGPTGQPVPVWHFQDDAVSGTFTAMIDPAMPNMPIVDQSDFVPQRYVFPSDGPDVIQQFSKDLAFELYMIPEPATWLLLITGVVAGRVIMRQEACNRPAPLG
jgi:hypothetical protein